MQLPVTVLNASTKRESGKKAQFGNIAAAKAVADIIRTTLGPRSMLKMLLDAGGGIVLTNDGHAILREIDVSHPAAKSVMQLSRAQDEEVGDGTTSVVVLAGELLAAAELPLERGVHPTVIARAYSRALTDALRVADSMAFEIDPKDRGQMLRVLRSCLGTKYTSRFGPLMAELALDAVETVAQDVGGGVVEVDVKNYAKVEKIPGGTIEECRVLKGVLFNKDVVVPGRMRRRIENPRVLLLDCPLEYKKGESQTSVEMSKEEDWALLLKAEEDWVRQTCDAILAHKPDVVITEKGLSDLAAHFLSKAGVSAIRRLRKTDANRVARACGATIVHRPDEIRDSDIGTGAGLFEVVKIGDEFFTAIVDCANPKACTILLRGASKDVLNEVERNLHDAMGVARNVVLDPRLVPGGGAVEMAAARAIAERGAALAGSEAWPYRQAGAALEVIPRTLAQNCGANVIRTLTKLRAKLAEASRALPPSEEEEREAEGLRARRAAASKGGAAVVAADVDAAPDGNGNGAADAAAAAAAAAAAEQLLLAPPPPLQVPSTPWGVDGEKGEVADMRELGVWEPRAVKAQTLKTAVEAATLLLRIDDVVSSHGGGRGGGGRGGGGPGGGMEVEDHEAVDSEAMLPE